MPELSDFHSSFPGAARYPPGGGVTGPRMVREESAAWPAFPYTERHLQCVWGDDAIRPARLVTAGGEAVTVCSPGDWNLEAGPDFLGAVLLIGPEQRRVVGDVEVHIRPRDWTSHGHSADPKYAHVVAHVTCFPGRAPCVGLPPGAVAIALRDALRADPSFGFGDIDVTAYPYAALPASPRPCNRALTESSPELREELLDSAGEERLRVKTIRMAASIEEHGPAQALYEEVMCALGYKHNRGAFRRLARVLPLDVLREEAGGNEDRAYALLLGVAGLLPAVPAVSWPEESRRLVRKLWDFWWKREAEWDSRCLPTGSWRLAGLRPQNHPRRRLAAAAALFATDMPLSERLATLDPGSPSEWRRQASAVFTGAGRNGFWGRRLSFGRRRCRKDTALIGSRRAAAILSNVVVPFLAATGVRVDRLLDQLPAEQDNSILRRTAFALFGHDHNPAMYESGLRQQGLLQIFHDFCLPNRAACEDCALVRALDGALESA